MGNPTQVKHSHPFIWFIARVTQFNKTAGFLHQGATFGPIGFGFRSSGDLSVVVAGVAVAVVSVGVVGVFVSKTIANSSEFLQSVKGWLV